MRRVLIPTVLVMTMAASSVAAVALPHIQLPDGSVADTPTHDDFGTLVRQSAPIVEPPAEKLDPIFEMPGPGASYEALLASYESALSNGRHREAVELADRMVEQTRIEHGEESKQHAWALSDLGAAFQHAEKFELALEPLRRSIAIHKRTQGVMHEDLIGAYSYLGMAFQSLDQHDVAVDEFSRAQSISHIHFGAMNLQQMKLLDAKALSWEDMGHYWEAEQLYRAKLRIARTNFSPESPEAIQRLNELAGWLRDTGQIKPSLSLYREGLKLLVDENGDDTPQMIESMRGMALTYLLDFKTEVDRGLRLNRRIVDVTERYPSEFTLMEQVRVHLDLGDWLILFDSEEQAWAEYARAWELAQQDDSGQIDWEVYFKTPLLIYAGPPLSIDFLGYRVIGKEQWSDFEFNIRPDGRPSHVRIVDSNTHKLTRLTSMDLIRKARFRPAMIEGEPQIVESFQFHRVYPTDPPPDYGAVSIGGGVAGVPTDH